MFCLLAECFLTNLSPSRRTVTHLSIRLHSRDTHTSSTCCYTMEHRPMNTLLLVHTGEYYDIHSKYFDSVSWPLLVDPNNSSSFDFLMLTSFIYLFICPEWEQCSVHCPEARLHLCSRHTQSGHRGNSDHSGAFVFLRMCWLTCVVSQILWIIL